jgi:exopolyphosphatase/pppGpp-phosphohydrolase
MQTDKIAVIELSTKAVKWLIPQVDNEVIQNNPFRFNFFSRESRKTETGNGLNKMNVLDERYFVSRVLPYIKQAYNDIINAGADVVYCVATAVYRSARNINSILQIIRDEINVEVRCVTEEVEAEYTLWAYYCFINRKETL